jgi:integrase
MLCRLAPKAGQALVTNLRTGERISNATVNKFLKRWMARQEWRDDCGNPIEICSHQFRPTFAQQIIAAYPKMNEYALKDHFKHHDANMTDGYVGKSASLKKLLYANCPGASKAAFEDKMRKAAGL